MGQKDQHLDQLHSIHIGSPSPGTLLPYPPVSHAGILAYSAASATPDVDYGTAAVDNDSCVGSRCTATHSLGLCEELRNKHDGNDSDGIHRDVRYVLHDAAQPSSS